MAHENSTPRDEATARTGDWRSWLLVLLALIPIVGAVAISVFSWIDEADEIAVYRGESYPIELSYQIHILSSALETSSVSLHAAALPDAGQEIMDRAADDRQRALEALVATERQSPELASAIASDVGIDPTPFLAYMDQSLSVVEERLQDHEPGQPVSERLVSSIETIDEDFGSRSIVVAGWDAQANLRIGIFRSLVEYRSSLADELQLIVASGGAAARAEAEASPRSTGTERRADAWDEVAPMITALPDVDRYELLAISPATPIEIDPADRLAATAIAGMSVAERDRLILDGLAIDDQAALDVAYTTDVLLDDLDRLIDERRGRQANYLIGGVLLLILGLALLVVARSETRRRQRVEKAHTDALSRLDTTASRDPLTGVWNRRHLDDQLTHLLQNRSTVGSLVVAYVDLDRFKAINDVWGHATGDEILRIVARRLSAVTITSLEPATSHEQASDSAAGRPPSQDMSARINVEVVRSGGDEFICYVPLIDPQVSTVADLGTKLITVVNRPILVDGQRHYVGATAGLAVSDEASTSDSLLLEADSSLILAKRNQRGTASVYNRRVSRSSELVKALPRALGNGQISCSYQPVVDLASGQVSHLEALARWTKPDGEEIDPSEFVPLVESFGMASRLTEVVLATIAEYQQGQSTPETGRIWLNVAPVELEVSDFAVRLFRMIERLEVEPERLGIEITETAAIGDPVHFANQLHQLRGIGMMTAIDDFGSGYSPLGYLKDLPIDLVKLDRSLISEIDTSPEYQQVVRGIIALTTELGMATAAEGVERPEELEWATCNGISYVQGFLVGEPSSAADIDWSRRLYDPVASSL